MLVEVLAVFGMITCATSTKQAPKTGPGASPAGQTAEDLINPSIRFSHKLHGEQAECAGCHATVSEEAKAGTPKLADCLDCHDGMQSEKPEDQAEEKKLEIYAAAKREIPWPRVAQILSSNQFSHKVHVVDGELECSECHGDIAQTDTLPTKTPVPFNHELCGQCHEVQAQEGQCRDCHVR